MARGSVKPKQPFAVRPWITGTQYDHMCPRNILHVDIFARHSFKDGVYFVVEFRLGGLDLVLTNTFHARADGLHMLDNVPAEAGLTDIFWTRATHDGFTKFHRGILEYVRAMCGAPDALARWQHTASTVLFHYVRTVDRDPWPRGFVNYKAANPLGVETRRKRRTRAEIEADRARRLADTSSALPDIL